MKKTLYIPVIIFVLALTTFSQKLAKPTLISAPTTTAQQKALQEGTVLHDDKKYDEAIAKYQSILTENHDCTVAMYEMSMTLYAKGEKEKALELANIGSKYVSDELPLFYVTMANVLDDKGKPQDAIELYQKGLKLLEGEKRFSRYRASLYYNLGVTYLQQKKNNEARASFKSAVENDFSYASPHYLLALVYNGTKYHIPAFLAAARLISLEYNTQRTKNSVDLVANALQPAKNPKSGNITINLDFFAPIDEGDFGMFDLLVPTLTTIGKEEDEKKSPNERFISAIGTIITMLGEDKKIKSTFVGKVYVPFMMEMKETGHVEAFGNMVLFINNKENADAAKWMDGNGPKLLSFLNWAKAYQTPLK